MQYLVLDTCIVLHILRNNTTGQSVMQWISGLPSASVNVVSVVTKGELDSLKIQHNWGEQRSKALDDFLREVVYVNINHSDRNLLNAYALIDAYSKGKGPDLEGNRKQGSAITMGKNDLWIAATAMTIESTLVTADGDFDHLDRRFLTIKKF